MKALKANITRGIPVRSLVETCDNSGAKTVRVFTVVGLKTVRGRRPAAGIGDLVMCSVVKGKLDMRKQVVHAIVVRQRKEYKRPTGERIKFEDNAVVVLKDDKGNPKGTIFKGPIAKEVATRWPSIGKLASIVV